MMRDKEDFFSPDMIDERLERSLLQHETERSSPDVAENDPNLLLISDLRYLYGAEGTENVRSLQRVWEHLKERPAPEVPADERGRHLHLLKPLDEELGREIRHKNWHMPHRALAALAALLFVVIMTGSLWTIVHFTRAAQAEGGNLATASGHAATAQPTSIPGYPYPPPGNTLGISPPSFDPFYVLAWSPNGRQLALSTENKIWLWDVAEHQYRPLVNVQLGGGSVRSLAWSPDGRYLAVGSNPIQIVDPASGNVIGTYSADYPISSTPGQATLVTALGWSPSGKLLAVATQHADGTCFVFVWDWTRGVGLNTFTQQGSASGISSLSWSGDSRYVASTDAQTVQAWDVYNPNVVIFKHAIDAATTVAWSPQPGLLAFVDGHETQIWNVWQGSDEQGELVSSYPAANGVVSWSPQGQYLATADGHTVTIFDARSGAHIYTYTGNVHYVSTLAWSPTGDILASGESGVSGSNFVRIWSA